MNELTAAPARDMTTNVARIVEAFLARNLCTAAELPKLIASIHATLANTQVDKPAVKPEILCPAVPISKSVAPHYVTCLECGKSFKSIRGHLRSAHNLVPAEYRQKWGLRSDHPMVAPEYASLRSKLSKQLAVGGRRRSTSHTVVPFAAAASAIARPHLEVSLRSQAGQPG